MGDGAEPAGIVAVPCPTVHRLKMLKRAICGRAKLDLPSRRTLLAAWPIKPDEEPPDGPDPGRRPMTGR